MNTLRNIALPLLVLLAGTQIAGCNRGFHDDSKVSATVNGEDVTEKDLENYAQMRKQRASALNDAERKQVLDELIDRVLLAQQASKDGLEKNADVYFGLKRVRENLLARQIILGAVKTRYDQKIMGMPKLEFKVRHILVKTEDDARKLAEQLKKGAKFEVLAKTKSLDTISGKEGGDLGWVSSLSGLVPDFINVVPGIEKGKVSDPVKTQFGYHLIKVEDTRPLELPAFEQALNDPRTSGFLGQMQEESMTEMQAKLKESKEKAKIVYKDAPKETPKAASGDAAK